MTEPVLEVENLTVQYKTSNGPVTAVSDASFTVEEGEYLGLVGESGCGKSTLAKSVMHGLDANATIPSGKILYKGEEIQDYTEAEMNERIRWNEISFVPQSSMNNLDPLQRISEQAIEIGQIHTDMTKAEIREKFSDLLETVGLQKERMDDYPHQFSGGMQQRIIIALSLLLDPSLIVADEPTTALDVIMQDQVFKYTDKIKAETDTSMVLITHDISLVFESCDEICVMHGGQVAEVGDVSDVFNSPRHPYSILLQEAFPDIRKPNQKLGTIGGVPPESRGEVNYCTFKDRCPWAVEDCSTIAPPLESLEGDTDHQVACIRKEEVRELYRQGDRGDFTEMVDGGDR